MIFQIDKTIYEQLSETERYIVDFISQNEDKISYLSITNIADKTFSSPATVSRTIQKCGFKGIAELRYLISKEDKDKSKNVSPYAINKLLDKVYQESTQTIENIPIPAILKAIDHINNAKKIFIYARGFTAMFAEHFQMYLQLMGYNAVVVKGGTNKKFSYFCRHCVCLICEKYDSRTCSSSPCCSSHWCKNCCMLLQIYD